MTLYALECPENLFKKVGRYIQPYKGAYIHGIGLAVSEDTPHRVGRIYTDLEVFTDTIQFLAELTIMNIYMDPRNRVGKKSC